MLPQIPSFRALRVLRPGNGWLRTGVSPSFLFKLAADFFQPVFVKARVDGPPTLAIDARLGNVHVGIAAVMMKDNRSRLSGKFQFLLDAVSAKKAGVVLERSIGGHHFLCRPCLALALR